MYFVMLCYLTVTTNNKTDDAGQKNDDGQKDDGEEEGGSDQTSQDCARALVPERGGSGVVGWLHAG